jgi:3alpha(or 20beta)-hydroxysteroid dehydrogenase
VTGAGKAQGIGAAVARRFCEEGASVLATDVAEDGERVCAALGGGDRLRYLHQDVTSAGDWPRVVDFCRTEFGDPTVLVNNAAIFRGLPVHEESLDGWHHVLNVNLTSVFLGMRTVIPIMLENGRGSIINVSSAWGLVAAERAAAYHASKGGVTLLSKNAGVAYATQGIRVNSVHPGGTDTPMLEETGRENSGMVVARTPMGRLAESAEIAEAVVFLASDEAGFVTGAAFAIDGGYTAI